MNYCGDSFGGAIPKYTFGTGLSDGFDFDVVYSGVGDDEESSSFDDVDRGTIFEAGIDSDGVGEARIF